MTALFTVFHAAPRSRRTTQLSGGGNRTRGRPTASLIRRPLQRLVRPGHARPHAAMQLPGPAQPHRRASGTFAAARADRASRAVGAAGRRRVTASVGSRAADHPNASMARGAAEAERPSSAAAETADRAAQPPHDTPSAAAPGSARGGAGHTRRPTAWHGPTYLDAARAFAAAPANRLRGP